MCDDVLTIVSSDDSDIDDSVPISSIISTYRERKSDKDVIYTQGEDNNTEAVTDQQRDAIRKDFLSSDSDSELPDIDHPPSVYDNDVYLDHDRLMNPFSDTSNTPFDSQSIASTCSTIDTEIDIEIDMGESSQSTTTSETNPDVKIKQTRIKRTAGEIDEQKRMAQAAKVRKADERLKNKQEKENKKIVEARDRALKNEVKKQNRATDCQKYMTVLIDTSIVNNGVGGACMSAFTDSDTTCVTQELKVKDTIQWKRQVSELSQIDEDSPIDVVHSEVLESEIMCVLTAEAFIKMVHSYKQVHNSEPCEGPTPTEYIKSIVSVLPDSSITLAVMSMDKYFRQQNTKKQRQHRQDVLRVTGNDVATQPRRKKGEIDVIVTRLDVEESLMEAQIQTDCNVHMLETPQQLADLVKCFTKAIAEAPIKKDRMESAFSFHCEPLTGVKVDKNGQGLLKIWKNQIRQFRAVSADMADAIVAAYPSPQLLVNAYRNCSSEREAERLLENLQVRRSAGLLETNRRIGKELSRRVHLHMTCTDPQFVIK